MTEQQKSSIKIVSTMILILVLPVLFFHLIGDDPAKQKKNATRNIAVVNEDMGASESENRLVSDRMLWQHCQNVLIIHGL